MNNLTTFDFNALPVRVVEREGEPWFVAADVCKALGLDNPSYVTKRLGEDEKASFKLPNQRGSAANIISESGLYKLIMRSDKSEAKAQGKALGRKKEIDDAGLLRVVTTQVYLPLGCIVIQGKEARYFMGGTA